MEYGSDELMGSLSEEDEGEGDFTGEEIVLDFTEFLLGLASRIVQSIEHHSPSTACL